MSDVLYVGQAVLDWMRDQAPRPAEPGCALPDGAARLFGIPVQFDASLPSGAWKLMRDGEQVGEGYIGREGEITAYLSGRGFVSLAEPEVSTPVMVRLSTQSSPGYERVRWLLSWLFTPPPPDPGNALKVTGA